MRLTWGLITLYVASKGASLVLGPVNGDGTPNVVIDKNIEQVMELEREAPTKSETEFFSNDELITLAPDPATTEEPRLGKRYDRNYIESKRKEFYAKYKSEHGEDLHDTNIPTPDPWIRTIYESVVEIVRPTVIEGVTFSGKPPTTTNGLEPWITLNKNGSPKTIRPQMKNGHIKNPSPTYNTWFATPTTMRYTKEELKAHNMADDEIHEEITYIEEDQTYQALNPIIRCTPDSYFKKGVNKRMSSEPFCFPKDNSYMSAGKTYFVTWFSKYFESENVRFHLSLIKESMKDKGTIKQKRSVIMDKGGKVTKQSFFTSDWIKNDAGIYPLEILESFFEEGEIGTKRVLLSIQPDDIEDENYDVLKNSLVLAISKPQKSRKKTKLADLAWTEEKQKYQHMVTEFEDGMDYEKYYAILAIPLIVCILALMMYVFVWVNKVDLSHLKARKAKGANHGHRRIPFKKKPANTERKAD